MATLIWNFVFVSFGLVALTKDYSIQEDPCGQSLHVWKYAVLNLVFAMFAIVTYVIFTPGGEGARARALSCGICHVGFAAWLFLMFSRATDSCEQVLEDKFSSMHMFLLLCGVHNTLWGGLFMLHELWLGRYMGYDLTLMLAVIKEKSGSGSFENIKYEMPQSLPPSTASPTPGIWAQNLPSSSDVYADVESAQALLGQEGASKILGTPNASLLVPELAS